MQFEQNFLDKHFWDSDNQILYDGCPKDKWITKFFSYSAHQSFLWRGHISAHPGEEGRGGSVQETGSEIPKAVEVEEMRKNYTTLHHILKLRKCKVEPTKIGRELGLKGKKKRSLDPWWRQG